MRIMSAVTATDELLNVNSPFSHQPPLIRDMNEYIGGKKRRKTKKTKKSKKSKKTKKRRW